MEDFQLDKGLDNEFKMLTKKIAHETLVMNRSRFNHRAVKWIDVALAEAVTNDTAMKDFEEKVEEKSLGMISSMVEECCCSQEHQNDNWAEVQEARAGHGSNLGKGRRWQEKRLRVCAGDYPTSAKEQPGVRRRIQGGQPEGVHEFQRHFFDEANHSVGLVTKCSKLHGARCRQVHVARGGT